MAELNELFAEQEQTLAEQTNEVAETTEQNESVEVAENEEEEEDTDDTTETADEESSEEEKAEEKPTQFMQTILAEMTKRSETDQQLATGLQSADKSISECVKYLNYRAEKLIECAKQGAVCLHVDDDEVYGWAVHYYTESKETIDAEMPKKPTYQPREKTAEEKKREETTKKVYENPLLASLMKKGAKIATDGEVAVTKTTTKKDENGNVVSSKTTKTDAEGTRTTTITKDGKEYTMTEFSLF